MKFQVDLLLCKLLQKAWLIILENAININIMNGEKSYENFNE